MILQAFFFNLINFNIKMKREESQLIVEAKFKKYKEKVLNAEVLGERDLNMDQIPKESKGIAETFIQQTEIDPLQFMMTDPRIYDLHESLKKQSEQRNKQILVKNFPSRYQQLLLKESACKNLEKKIQQLTHETAQKQNKYQIVLREKTRVLDQKQAEINELRGILKEKKQLCNQELLEKIKRKDMEIYELQETRNRCQKLKEDYKNSSKVIAELREQEYERQQQNQRLVQKLQQTQEKVVKAHRQLLKAENQKSQSIKNLTEETQRTLRDLREQLQQNQVIIQQLNSKLDFKESLIEMLQIEKQGLIERNQKMCSQKFEEIQKLRQDYLQSLKNIDILQNQLSSEQELQDKDNEIKDSEISHCKKSLEEMTRSFSELNARFQCEKKLTNTKSEVIESIKQQLKSVKLVAGQLQEEKKENLQKIKNLQEELFFLRKSTSEKEEENSLLKNKLEEERRAFEQKNKHLTIKVNQNQAIVNSLKEKVQLWLEDRQIVETGGEGRGLKRYQQIVEKLKNEIVGLRERSRKQMQKQNKVYQIVLQENKELRQKLYQ